MNVKDRAAQTNKIKIPNFFKTCFGLILHHPVLVHFERVMGGSMSYLPFTVII